MHFPNISATLPRKWRLTSSTEEKSVASESQPTRRISTCVSSTSAKQDPRFHCKPPLPSCPISHQSRPCSSSSLIAVMPTHHKLSRSTSFSSSCSREKRYLPHRTVSCSTRAFSSGLDFKKPLPVPGRSRTNKPSSFYRRPHLKSSPSSGSPTNSSQFPDRTGCNVKVRSDSSVSKKGIEWRSRSLVDLNKAPSSLNNIGSVVAVVTPFSGGFLHGVSSSNNLFPMKPDSSRFIPLRTFSASQDCLNLASENPLRTSHAVTTSREAISSSLLSLHDKHSSGIFPNRQQEPVTATVLSKNLRSNSWRNLSTLAKIEPLGGMNKNHRLSQGAKKVSPPIIPAFNPRCSGSSFGSDYSFDVTDPSYSRDPSGGGGHCNRNCMNYPKQSPGRDSPGDDSSASIGTVESSSVSSSVGGGGGGCYRNSTTSLDSGRATSNSNSTTTSEVSTFQPIHEHRALVNIAPTTNLHNTRCNQLANNSGVSTFGTQSSFRQSYHHSSSTSSLKSGSRSEDAICALDIPQMVAEGVADEEILLSWLTDMHYEEYYDLFVASGYDMPTISRMTPEDLTAIGIKKPNHRKRLKAEIMQLDIPDGLPNFVPASLRDWLNMIRLSEYETLLKNQGYISIDNVAQISIEDFEDVGIYKLGHQKRLLLAVKRIKDLKSGRRKNEPLQPPLRPMPPPRQTPVVNNNASSGVGLDNRFSSSTPSFLLNGCCSQSHVSSSGQQQLMTNSDFPPPPHLVPNVVQLQNSPLPPPVAADPASPTLNATREERTHSRCCVSPPLPSPPLMPQPMEPLQSYTQLQMHQHNLGFPSPPPPLSEAVTSSSLTPNNNTHSRPLGTVNNGLGIGVRRSFDDTDIIPPDPRHRHLQSCSSCCDPSSQVQTGVGHNFATISGLGGGGTLPRPKGLVKPRPIAKITGNPQQHPAVTYLGSSVALHQPGDDLKKQRPITSPLRQSMTSCGNEGHFQNSSPDTFPFAKDNIGTIRVRSNSSAAAPVHSTQMSSPTRCYSTNIDNPFSPEKGMNEHQQRTAASINPVMCAPQGEQVSGKSTRLLPAANHHRTAGDVLNDIGSMLADLTDELDAMLHTDPSSKLQQQSF